jgi:hypothetical protein
MSLKVSLIEKPSLRTKCLALAAGGGVSLDREPRIIATQARIV